MEVAPHFLWSFAIRYAVEQLNLWLRVSHPETSPILRWTGEVGDASAFRSGSDCPPFVGGELAFGSDVFEDSQFELECLAIVLSRFASMLLCPKGDPDALDIPTRTLTQRRSRVPPHGANIVDGMWIFRVKRTPGSSPAFKARYVARGFSQRQGFDFLQTFSPAPKMTTLWVLLHIAAQRDYELHSFNFSTAFLQGSLHEEIWLRRPSGFTGSFPEGTQWSLRRPVYGLRQAPRECHNTLRNTLPALGFAPSTADPSLFLRTDPALPPFYILVLQRFGFEFSLPQSTPLPTGHSLSAPPSDESVEPSGQYPELVACLITSGMWLVLGGRGLVVLTGDSDASWADDQATQRSSQGYSFSLGSGSVLWRSTRSSSVLGFSFLYVDNKAMIVLCQDLRLEHRMKNIALRYFLARELHLAYVASRANTADALGSGFNAGFSAGFNAGFSAGSNAGFSAGFNAGLNAGFNSWLNAGFNSWFNAGFNSWFNAGFNQWFNAGFNLWFNTGFNPWFNTWFNAGFNPRFNAGFNPCFNAGFNLWFNAGFNPWFNAGFNPWFNAVFDAGFDSRFSAGFDVGLDSGFGAGTSKPAGGGALMCVYGICGS
ncbi:unnamed protein product [Closterium sp. NIES-54]